MAQSGINLAMTPKAELTDLQKLELKEAFDEFDKVLLRLLFGYNKEISMIMLLEMKGHIESLFESGWEWNYYHKRATSRFAFYWPKSHRG